MFHQPTKKTAPTDAKPLSMLTAILSPEQLLSDSKRQATLTLFARTSEFEPSLFDSLCVRLIKQVSNHCQRLPESILYYALPGGLLDHALARTQAAVQLFRQYLLPDPNEALSDEQKRWWYALFSASLLRGIGTLSLDYRVDRYSMKGQPLKQWEPLLESLGNVNNHYWFELKTSDDYALRRRLTLLLARRLMPEEGFAWIASNRDVLAVWLALLDEDSTSAGALGAILDRADAVALQHELNHLPIRGYTPARDRPARIGTFVDNTPEPVALADKERVMALEFIRWVQQELDAGKFVLNRAPLLHFPGGLIVSGEAFKLFAKEHVSYKNWQTIQRGVLALIVHRPGEHGAAISKHEHSNGLVIAGSLGLPESFSFHDPSTGKTTKTTATALALTEYPQRLSRSGVWDVPQQPLTAQIKPKATHG